MMAIVKLSKWWLQLNQEEPLVQFKLNDELRVQTFVTDQREDRTKGVTSGAGTSNPSGAPEFTPGF
jgi:hypothetical protein